MSLRIQNIVIDCADPRALAVFWEAATGFERRDLGEDWVVLRQPGGGLPTLLLQRVPEPKRGKNRVHVDWAAEDRDAEVARLEALGARRVERHDEFGISWTIMLDPEGNEFCVAQH